VSFGAGVLVGIPALRLSGVYLALATFSVALVVWKLVEKFRHFTNGRQGIQFTTFPTGHHLYVYTWTVAGIMFVLAWLILHGRIGRAFRAIRDSDVAAVSSGVNLSLYKILAFGISAAFGGVAGSLFVYWSFGATPDQFTLLLSLRILIGAVLGGLGSLWGVGVGALIVYELAPQGSLSSWIQNHVPNSTQAPTVFVGVVVILVVVLLPFGFAGVLRRLVTPIANRFGAGRIGNA